jgi:hypothetical protein
MRVQRYDTGEPTHLLDLQSIRAIGVDANDRERTAAELTEAFRDWQSSVEATQRGRDGLYHCEISPEARYARDMTKKAWLRLADIAGEELGLDGQPRAVVLHAGKDGRPHLHVVWQRTDLQKMKVISDAYNYIAHERASDRMEKEFGHDFIPGKHAKRDRKRQKDFPRAKLSQAEDQYQKRTGLSKEQRLAEIAGLKAASENGPAFKAALEEAGYVLAQGDRHAKTKDQRSYVVVDWKGGQSVLTRNVGLNKVQIDAFMKGVELDKLPTVQEAKAVQAERRKAISKVKAAAERAAAEQAPQPASSRDERKKLKEELAAMKATADGAQAFKAAIEQAGLILANGDRGYTLVDDQGEVYNLARQLKLKLAEVDEYMAPVALASLPTVEQAQAIQAERRETVSKSNAQVEAEAKPEEKGVEASGFLEAETPQQQPEPIQPQEDAALEALKKKLAARQAQEIEKWAGYHAHQLRQKEHELDIWYAEKVADFDAVQQQERDALNARLAEKRTGIKGIIDAIENRWNPTVAADKAKERRREIALLKRRQEKERVDYLALQEQSRQLEIENLKEQQALKRQDQARKHGEEWERYIREYHEGKRIAAETEARRRQEEELERNESLRDGPPPPELGK